jgi:hypothetical protein
MMIIPMAMNIRYLFIFPLQEIRYLGSFFFTTFCKKVVNCRISLPFTKMTSLIAEYHYLLQK